MGASVLKSCFPSHCMGASNLKKQKHRKTRYFLHKKVNYLGASNSKPVNHHFLIELSKPSYFTMKNKIMCFLTISVELHA